MKRLLLLALVVFFGCALDATEPQDNRPLNFTMTTTTDDAGVTINLLTGDSHVAAFGMWVTYSLSTDIPGTPLHRISGFVMATRDRLGIHGSLTIPVGPALSVFVDAWEVESIGKRITSDDNANQP